MVVLLWLVGTSAPPLPSGHRARTTSIGLLRARALKGLSALWRPPAVPGLWHRGPPAPQPIRPAVLRASVLDELADLGGGQGRRTESARPRGTGGP
ncbi:hypothetical protein HMPREF9057_03084, partial [Actinomyces sp. oral taxon 171 str. F0337]